VPGSALWVGRGVDHYFGNKVQRLTRVAPDQSLAFVAAMAVASRWIAATAEHDRDAAQWLRTKVTVDHAVTTERWAPR